MQEEVILQRLIKVPLKGQSCLNIWEQTEEIKIHEEIKSRLKSENTCYHWVKNILSSSLLPKNLKIMIHITIIFLNVLYGCDMQSFKLREEDGLKLFGNRLSRRIFGPKMGEVTREQTNYIGRFHPFTDHEGPQGEQRYRSTLFQTSALEGGERSASRPGRFTPGKDLVPFVQEGGWAPGPVWTGAENLAPSGFDPRTVQPVCSRYTDYATRPNRNYIMRT